MNATLALLCTCSTLAFAGPPAAAPSEPAADVKATAPVGAVADPVSAWTQPVGVAELLVARPFLLSEPFESDWRQERPLVRSGWILVVEVDAALARVRQVESPILYVGAEVAERVNLGTAPGREPAPTVRLVVIVPAPTTESGEVAPMLNEAPIYFGTPGLAEQIDAATGARERAAALAAGLQPIEPAKLAQARARGGATLQAADRAALLAAVAPLVRTWSPTESDQADLLEGKPITRQATPEQP